MTDLSDLQFRKCRRLSTPPLILRTGRRAEVAQGKHLAVIEPGRGRTIRAQEMHLVGVPAGKPQSTGPRE